MYTQEQLEQQQQLQCPANNTNSTLWWLHPRVRYTTGGVIKLSLLTSITNNHKKCIVKATFCPSKLPSVHQPVHLSLHLKTKILLFDTHYRSRHFRN